MSDNNQFQPYRYSGIQSGQQPEQSTRPSGGLNLSAGGPRGYEDNGSGIFGLFKRPGIATGVLLFGAAIIATVLFFGSSSEDIHDSAVPIIKADATPVRELPDDPQGLEIPFGDNSIFASPDLAQAPERPPVENLLDNAPQTVVVGEAGQTITIQDASEDAAKVIEDAVEDLAALSPSDRVPESSVIDSPVAPPQVTNVKDTAPPVQQLHKPGDAPETLAFVQSVLKEKDNKENAAKTTGKVTDFATIKPAAGAATPKTATAIKPGSYYVQLASVQSQSGAHNEWGKIKNTYESLLRQADYRVKQADLGERGIYYRIQAGPMSKDDANRICNEIKTQKPGGCLVTK